MPSSTDKMAPGTQRYERVPTQDDLYSLHTVSDSYNYGSGIPSSPPPSFHSSAGIQPSLPSSSSAPGPLTPSSSQTPSYQTARHPLTSSNLAALPENDVTPAYTYPLGGVGGVGVGAEAETLVDGTIRDDATITGDSSLENPLILNLHKRISQLETSMGRLLIQNDELRAALAGTSSEALENRRSNCFVSYADDDEELRRMMRGRDNCCVSIGKRDRERKGRREEWMVFFWMMGLVGFFGVVIVFIHAVFGTGSGSGGKTETGKGH